MKKLLLFSSIIVMIGVMTGLLGYRPINASKENCEDIRGIVTEVYGINDAVIRLAGNNEIYYINRGLKNRFTLTGLRKSIVGKQVIVSYAKHWTMLPTKSSRHIAQLKVGKEILYSEF